VIPISSLVSKVSIKLPVSSVPFLVPSMIRLSLMIAALARGDVVDPHLVPDQIVSFGWVENFTRPHQTLWLREDRRDPAASQADEDQDQG